jgi:two-component system, OmpR family, phosphate regulon response regulator OmpR
MTARILMIEDDHRLAAMVRDYLGQQGFSVTLADDVAQGFSSMQREPFELVLLDLMLPDGNGLDVCRRIRALPPNDKHTSPHVAIVMLTAKGDAMDRVIGLEIGADDYVAKPFEPRELLARIRAVLRRREATANPSQELLNFGRLEIDRDARLARIDGVPCDMTAHQFDLLVVMAERAGRVLTRERLMDLLKGEPLEAFDRSIDVHIARIRAAIEDEPKHPRRIITVRGAGYVFAKAQE